MDRLGRGATNPASKPAPSVHSIVTENQNRRTTVNPAVARTVTPAMVMNAEADKSAGKRLKKAQIGAPDHGPHHHTAQDRAAQVHRGVDPGNVVADIAHEPPQIIDAGLHSNGQADGRKHCRCRYAHHLHCQSDSRGRFVATICSHFNIDQIHVAGYVATICSIPNPATALSDVYTRNRHGAGGHDLADDDGGEND